jgi:predicted alpha/beta-hydrolase family hydrolase
MDIRKEDFRKYLERNGVIEALTKGYIKVIQYSLDYMKNRKSQSRPKSN